MYTTFILIALGLLGVTSHTFVELNKVNKASGGNAKLLEYWKLERFNIIISVIVVCVCAIVKQELLQVEPLSNWVGVGFFAIGYMGQSLLIFAMGKASSKIGKDDSQ